jgi:prevent-host-death family protein
MPTINISAAKTQLSRLIRRAAAGEEIVITKAGKPVAKLVSLSADAPRAKRKLGALAGRLVIPPEFDDPLPDELLDAFEGR